MKTILALYLILTSSALFAQSNDRPGQLIQLHPSIEPAPTKTSIDPAKEAHIRQLLDVTGAKTMMMQQMGSMESTLKPLLANSLPPGEYRAKLIELFFEKFHAKADTGTLVDLIVPIYDKYLSDEDIMGMIQFYSTPLGKKVIEVLPKLAGESQQTGRQWGEQLGRQTMIEVLDEHPDLKQALQDAKQPPLPR